MSAFEADSAARARVTGDLRTPIALEAGAGTGKTTALVARIVALLRAGTELRRMAVVTFLRAAAEEMRVRLRAELAGEADDWARRAEAQLPGAAIGTIHSLAQRLLAQEAEAAAWDPATRILEEDEAKALARHHFRWWLEAAAAADPGPLLALRRLGVAPSARALLAMASRLGPDCILPARQPPVPPGAVDDLTQSMRDALATFERLAVFCTDPADAALDAGRVLHTALAELDGWTGDERVAAACRVVLPGPGRGNQKNWQPPQALKDLKATLGALSQTRAALRTRAGEGAAAALLAWLAPYAAFAADRRRSLGVATFDDLMRRSVDLFERDDAARRRTAARYDSLLVDEFQDTDPLQARLLSLLAGPPALAVEGAVARLFVVGDPKQAIYRFRGADLATYIDFTGRFAPDDRLPLVDNHRARSPLLDLPNRLCPPLMADGRVPYRALVGGRGPVEPGAPPPIQVLSLPDAPRAKDLEEARRTEARWLASHLRGALDTPWQVDGRAIEPGDIALLFRTRTAYGIYADALAHFGIAHTAERDRDLWRIGVGRDLARILLAVAQPRSPIAVAAALRTQLVGASDQDLWRFAQAGGRFDLEAALPAHAPTVISGAIEALRAAAAARAERPSRRLLRLIDVLDLAGAAVLAEGEAGAKSLGRVVETVRVLEERRPGGMGALADVAAAMAGVGEGDGGDDAPLPDPAPSTDPLPQGGAVRLLTVHEAKGNQFPVVVLCDLWGVPPAARDPLYVSARDGRTGLWLRPASGEEAIASAGAAELRAADALAAQEELVRLLYVALTRAREVLVLSDVQPVKPSSASMGVLIRTAAGLGEGSGIGDALAALGIEAAALRPLVEPAAGFERLDDGQLAGPPADLADLRERLRARAGAVPIVRPSRAETEGALPGSGPAGGPWIDRERARRLGIAVHAVFAEALGAGAAPDIGSIAARVAGREGLTGDEEAEVLTLARAALSHPLVRRARVARHRAVEAAVSARTPAGGMVVGRADLVFDEGGGSIVIDLKTDRLPALTERAATSHALARGYDRQLALYAFALEAAMGTPVREAWVLYARGGVEVRVAWDSNALSRAASAPSMPR